MKIADFNKLPLMSIVKYKGAKYTLTDKMIDSHTAVMTRSGKGGKKIIRCSEIELYHEKKK